MDTTDAQDTAQETPEHVDPPEPSEWMDPPEHVDPFEWVMYGRSATARERRRSEELARRTEHAVRAQVLADRLKREADRLGREAWNDMKERTDHSPAPPPDGIEPPPEGIHRKTVAWAHAAHPLLSDMDTVDGIVQAVACEREQSRATAYKWLCDRNPMYEPGGSIPKRFESLRTSIERTYTHVSPR